MTKPRRRVPKPSSAYKRHHEACQTVLAYFREWPTIEALIHDIYPAFQCARVGGMHEAIEFFLWRFGTTPAQVLPQPKAILHLSNDPWADEQRLAGVRYWFKQWESIAPLLMELDAEISGPVITAVGSMARACDAEIVAGVELARVRAQQVYHLPPAIA